MYVPPSVVGHNGPACLADHSLDAIGEDVWHGCPVLHSTVCPPVIPPGVNLERLKH